MTAPTLEHERKFLYSDTRPLTALPGWCAAKLIVQTYLPETGRWAARVRASLPLPRQYATADSWRRELGSAPAEMFSYELILKRSLGGCSSQEVPATLSAKQWLAATALGKRPVRKLRHYVRVRELLWEVDQFLGLPAPYQDLVVAEVELPQPDYPLWVPSWCGKEVTGRHSYSNQHLWAWENQVHGQRAQPSTPE